MSPLEKLKGLEQKKQRAFLALFAGARRSAQVARVGADGGEIPPSFGKAECDWIADWRDFYGRELPELGFLTYDETEPTPALGMAPGSTCWNVNIVVTEEGSAAREEYWNDLRARSAQED